MPAAIVYRVPEQELIVRGKFFPNGTYVTPWVVPMRYLWNRDPKSYPTAERLQLEWDLMLNSNYGNFCINILNREGDDTRAITKKGTKSLSATYLLRF